MQTKKTIQNFKYGHIEDNAENHSKPPYCIKIAQELSLEMPSNKCSLILVMYSLDFMKNISKQTEQFIFGPSRASSSHAALLFQNV